MDTVRRAEVNIREREKKKNQQVCVGREGAGGLQLKHLSLCMVKESACRVLRVEGKKGEREREQSEFCSAESQ